jgi:hypothetical protein
MASPHVAGLAARIWKFEAEYPDQATRISLQENAYDVGDPDEDNATGLGIPIILAAPVSSSTASE